MTTSHALTLAAAPLILVVWAAACSSSSSSSKPDAGGEEVDSSSGGPDTSASGDGSSSSSGGDTGAPDGTGSPADTGAPTDATSDVVDAPYCAAVQELIDAGAIGMMAGACFDMCCTPLTTCLGSTQCAMMLRCVTECSKTTDAGSGACITTCEADGSAQSSMDLNQLVACVANTNCGH
jgi:hypothetical protein